MQFTGTAYISVNGKMLRSKPGASLKVGGMERQEVVANGKIVGYTEKPVPSELDCTVAHTGDTDLLEMSAYKDATVTFETDSGQTYTIANAWTSEPCDLKSDSGDTSLKMKGPAAT